MELNRKFATNAGPANLVIAYEKLGDPLSPPLLLIMGGGAQMIAWPALARLRTTTARAP
jgi:hypothetical protein